jgi:membrane protein DedA with SNARE-associated domain
MNGSTTALVVLFVVAVVPMLPTEVTIIGMGVEAAHHETTLLPVIAVAAAGCAISDQVLYAVGRFGGPRVVSRLRKRQSFDSGVRWLDGHLRRHPVPMLVVVRWLPSGGTVGALLAGALNWPRGTFAIASVIGVTLWTSYVAVLGYLGGRVIEQPGISLLFSLAIATVLTAALSFTLKRRQRATSS